MYYTIYKITNLVNGKYYIGRHATKDVNDSYMGSGIGIKNAIAKYGVENFTKEIIAQAESAEALWDLEMKIVNEEVVKDPMSYNNAYGGKHYLHGLKQHNPEAFVEHQRQAGLKGGQVSYMNRDKDWHAKGGAVSSKKMSEQYHYTITTNTGEKYNVDGIKFKKLWEDKDWNYNTLHWKKSMGKKISRGKHKGFLVEQTQNYKDLAHEAG